MMSSFKLSLGFALCALGALCTVPAVAQTYPTKTVSIVVSYPAGGDTDVIARIFAERLGAKLGQPFVVENKPGASGTIGNALVAKAPADGYTLLFTPSTISTALLVLKTGSGAPYDTLGDFTSIMQVGTQPLYLFANSGAGMKTVKEVIDAAKADKIKTYGSPGSGSPMHVLGEMFNRSAATKLQQVPYRGTGPVVTDLVGGHLAVAYSTLGPMMQHVSSGKVLNLAIADSKRSALSPDVPTLAELGVKDAEITAWIGVMGPKGMPLDVVRTLNAAMNEILKAPDVQQRLRTMGTVATGGDAAVLARAHAGDYAKYGKVIQDLKIVAE
ncbi:MAG: tripartite tricarboxylate transporter substrate binding protein [Cytophagales bacterium]|nr:tripartite tricarboxylate transporter substrate binding protein [Cytophagales bacterium]